MFMLSRDIKGRIFIILGQVMLISRKLTQDKRVVNGL